MDNLIFEPTTSTPAIRFTSDGRLLIEGRSLPENVMTFYTPLIDWVTKLTAKVVKVDINIEYLNSASSKKLLEMLRALDANSFINELIINWHYESDDDDALESGQIYEELLLRAEFRFHEYSEAA